MKEVSKSAHSGIGQFRISVLILRQFEFALKVPVEGLRATLMGQERQMMQMQNCPIAVWFDLVKSVRPPVPESAVQRQLRVRRVLKQPKPCPQNLSLGCGDRDRRVHGRDRSN